MAHVISEAKETGKSAVLFGSLAPDCAAVGQDIDSGINTSFVLLSKLLTVLSSDHLLESALSTGDLAIEVR